MTDYRVTWEADVEAANPEVAARLARLMQTRQGTIATVFDVFEEGKEPVRVDLTEIDEGKPVDEVSAALGFMTTGVATWDCPCCGRHYEGEDVAAAHGLFGRTGRCFEDCPGELEVIDAGSGSDLATILAALRLFQKTYESCDSDAIRADFPEHFTDNDGKPISPLGSEDIDDLCERLNCGKAAKPVGTTKVKVWMLTGSGDACPSAEVMLTELAAWKFAAVWLLENHESDLEDEVEGTAVTYGAALKASLEEGSVEAIRQWVENIAELLDSEIRVERHELEVPAQPEPTAHAIVVISGGVGEVAETTGKLTVDILDYDNIKETLNECRPWPYDPTGNQPWKRDLHLSPAELAYIRKHDDAKFVAEVEAALTLESLNAPAPAIPPVSEEERLAAREAAALARVVKVAKCPHCGQVGGIERLTDAWLRRSILGFDAQGEMVSSEYADTNPFDEYQFRCVLCDQEVAEEAIQQVEPEV